MLRQGKILLFTWGGLLALLVSFTFGARPSLAMTCQVSPEQVPIDILYHGSKLKVNGTAVPGTDLVIRISDGPSDMHLKYKGKAAGLFWMKIGSMEFKNVPGVYLLFTSKALDSRAEGNFGFRALQGQAAVESSAGEVDQDRWFAELVKYKQKEKLYAVNQETVSRSGDQFEAVIDWPFQAPPGTYTVEALALQDGQVVDQATASFSVARAGMVQTLSDLAFNSAAIYGIMALVIAMAAGFAVGALFKGGGAH